MCRWQVAITSWLVVAITSLLLVAALQLVAEQVLVAHRARGANTQHRTHAPAHLGSISSPKTESPTKRRAPRKGASPCSRVCFERVGRGWCMGIPAHLLGWMGRLVGWLVGWLVGMGQTGFTDRCPKHLLRTPGMALWQHARYQRCPSNANCKA